jgi:predicted HTH domain antitoxin
MSEAIEVKLSLPRSILLATGVREHELPRVIRETLAIELYRQGRISLGKAMELAGVPTKYEMLALLAQHGVYLDYQAEDAEADVETLKQIDRS